MIHSQMTVVHLIPAQATAVHLIPAQATVLQDQVMTRSQMTVHQDRAQVMMTTPFRIKKLS
jgi:hypothetical protein